MTTRRKPSSRDGDAVVPGAEAAAHALREAAVLLAPMVMWLLRSGASYGALAAALKPVFVDAARQELERAGRAPTDSALSVLSGVHRKDVRALGETPRDVGDAAGKGVPLASQVYTRWLTARRYRDRKGAPKALPRAGAGISFETLAREVSVDVHPRTLMDELIRLGLVVVDGDLLVPAAASFVPSRQRDELTALFAANAADHIAAAVHNLTSDGPRFLEQSVFAEGLGGESTERLHALARTLWRHAFDEMVGAASEGVARDAALPEAQRQRMRFGVYFYSEPQAALAPAAPRRARKESKK